MQPSDLELSVQDVQQLQQQQADFLLLDCREQEEYDTARIEGAVLIPMSELMKRVSELDPHRQRQLIVHCHHGKRSLQVATWLRQQGFDQAQSMSGGIDLWSVEIDPAVPRY